MGLGALREVWLPLKIGEKGKEEQNMNRMIMELLWLLQVYSFLGWVLETVVGSIKRRRFVNPGFSTGPFCLVYGIAAVLMTVIFQDLKSHPVFLVLGCSILGTTVEWYTGKLLERFNRHKWWDYSQKKWNFDGYICLQYSLLWGALGALTVDLLLSIGGFPDFWARSWCWRWRE